MGSNHFKLNRSKTELLILPWPNFTCVAFYTFVNGNLVRQVVQIKKKSWVAFDSFLSFTPSLWLISTFCQLHLCWICSCLTCSLVALCWESSSSLAQMISVVYQHVSLSLFSIPRGILLKSKLDRVTPPINPSEAHVFTKNQIPGHDPYGLMWISLSAYPHLLTLPIT